MANAARKLQVSSTTPDAPAPRASLISPQMDMLMIGGGSLLLFALMSVMLKSESPDSTLGWFVFNLSFLVNFPHFLVSYQLLYTDFGKKIFKDLRFFWAGIVAPLILLGLFVTGFATGNPTLLGYMASSMYFFVGWHYVKQIFGGITVSNALNQFYYNKVERFALKTNLFSLWALSFLRFNVGSNTYSQDGISYSSFNFPAWTVQASYVAIALSALAVIYLNLRKYIHEGKWPCGTAIICFLSIYVWYLPAFSHPMYMHTIPFFHSLQYLLFVYVFRRNKVDAQIKEPHTAEGRKQRIFGLYGYLCIPVITGGILMFFLPRYIDSFKLHNETLFGPTAAYFAFILFINIHHYFIDNVIWRGNNEEIREHLFKTRRQA